MRKCINEKYGSTDLKCSDAKQNATQMQNKIKKVFNTNV